MALPEPETIERRLQPLDRGLDRLGIDRATGAVLAIVLVGLLARLLALGVRLAHFDEGRVGYWILHFMETGEFHYRFIIHGPFVQHVNTVVFSAFGATDFTMRLVVALIGAALPLTVLLLREHLTDVELVAAAGFLAFNPVLLYYSRFFRSTIPVAAFCFAAFAFAVRFYDTRRARYAHAAVVLFALGFAAKENAVVYLLVFLGAGALLLDAELFRPSNAPTGVAWLGRTWRETVRSKDQRSLLLRAVGHVALAVGLFALVTLFFYAPRAGTQNGLGLYNALTDPGQFPALIDATVADLRIGFEHWFGESSRTGNDVPLVEQYRNYLERTLSVLWTYAGPLIAFAAIGAIVDRYVASEPRNLVQFSTYWGVVSVFGYPLGTDIFGAWIAVNMLVPFAIPAAVGVAVFYRWCRDAYRARDELSVAIVAVLSVMLVAQIAGTGVAAVYTNPTAEDNDLVQYAQPGDPALRGTLEDIERIAEARADQSGGGPIVLLVGQTLFDRGDEPIEPGCANLQTTLPLQWYFTRADASADCVRGPAEFDAEYGDSPPPVIVATPEQAGAVEQHVPSYERRPHLMRTHIERLVFFVDTDRLDGT